MRRYNLFLHGLDWRGPDCVCRSNPANNQPVTTKYLYYAKKAGTKVFVVNPYNEPGMQRYWVPSVTESALFGTKIADDFFQVHLGGDIPFFYGVIKHLIENNWLDREFIAARTVMGKKPSVKARSLSWEALERGSGLTRTDMFRFAEDLRQGSPCHCGMEHGHHAASLRHRQCSRHCEPAVGQGKHRPSHTPD